MQTESCYVKKEKTTMSSVVLLISFHEVWRCVENNLKVHVLEHVN